MTEVFDWVKPSPLWQTSGTDVREQNFEFFRPQVLEVRSDTFLDDFLAAAGAATADPLRKLIAAPPDPTQTDSPLKLFQPAHGCFYLTCASLCCRVPGLPDRQVRLTDQEDTFFVLRKLVNGAEYGWVVDGTTRSWQPLNGQPRRLLDNEERLPLHKATAGNGRDLWYGYIPVASSATYAVPAAQLGFDTPTDLRVEELRSRFTDQLPGLEANQTKLPSDVLLQMSVYLFLDLWEYLNTYLPGVATALRDTPSATLPGADGDLLSFLRHTAVNGTLTLAEALTAVAQHQADLNQPGGVDGAWLASHGFDSRYNLAGQTLDAASNDLLQLVQAALPPDQSTVILPKLDPRADATYVLRCVYERPQCEKPIAAVSLPSKPFRFAPFFDPDAPARQVRIPLPADVSIAGLRKFKKGVAIMMSNSMRQKMRMLDGHERDMLKDPPSAGQPDNAELAFICSFSIQIIFIVSFFLLLTFVIILNFVFWWIAFFRICLPLPKGILPDSSGS